jgi:hypothetical protein
LPNGAGRTLNENPLTRLHPRRPMKELVRRRPAQNQGGRLRRVNAHRHASQVARLERAIAGVGPDYGHVGDPVAHLIAGHALAELIDFPDNIIALHKWRPEKHRLRIEMTPDHHVRVFNARREYANAHLTPPSRRHGSVDHLQAVGSAISSDLNYLIACVFHRRFPREFAAGANAKFKFGGREPSLTRINALPDDIQGN